MNELTANVLQISEGKDLETKNLNLKTEYNMKTRTSFYNRTFAFAYVLLVAVIFCGCVDCDKNNLQINKKQELDYYTVMVDSCEYLRYKTDLMFGTSTIEHSYKAEFMIHKGNCKFCAERSKK